MVIVGTGGHGREVHDVAAAATTGVVSGENVDLEFLGFLDDKEPDAELLKRRRARWLGPVDLALAGELPPDTVFSLGVGSGPSRRRLDGLLCSVGLEPVTLVHPSVSWGRDVRIGAGVFVAARSVITTNVTLGRHVHINVACTVSHDVVIDDYATLSPAVNLAGNVFVGHEALLGINSSVIQGVRVGAGATVGAGGVAIRDVSAGSIAVGVPARPRG